ncbi:coiled-coil domain-containing protein 6-like [Tigriopus californicus]|uniref:coiled-coil domain-containing protein 6-like n=1 Tax=Tigriopus californicus TaxID=6832 RepID=UPI0027DA254D|nr:coiled-coil domain-containing protein 6-like [Tigriopus californicus]
MSSASEDAGLVTPPIAQTPPRGVVDMDQQSEDGDTCSVMSIDGDPLVAPSTPTPAGSGGGGRAGTPSGVATPTALMAPPSPVSRDQLQKRIESLQQQNRVLKCELETYKLRVKSLQEENKAIRQASVHIQAKAEQEEEFISNTLLKKIQELKKEKESLALNYEQEEECLTNDLSRKLNQLRQEKIHLEHTLEQEQECLVNKLMRRIEKLESETSTKQNNLETLRREKVELENTLEQEQEALVNKLWKRMNKLETEKRSLQVKLDQPVSEPPSPRSINELNNGDTAANLANNIQQLRQEVTRLKKQLEAGQAEHEAKVARYAKEEQEIREENLKLQRRLQLEMERREALCRTLSESESSLEMEEERVYNEMSSHIISGIGGPVVAPVPGVVVPVRKVSAAIHHRTRTLSSPIPPVVSAGLVGVALPPPLANNPVSPPNIKFNVTPPQASNSLPKRAP